ncbi:MAG: molybdenum cofactor guanylyltransferase [Acidobacteria bacterium]|nr:MAG: molybdenum cofactor guanylyltransferase [Acidobacteriota bacterium]
MISDITGVILAGGKSSRMGRNKALLPFRGRPLIETIRDTMSSIFNKVVISVHQENAYPQIDLLQIPDLYPETGPIGGITSVLQSGEERIFCVACDMPFLNRELIEYLAGLADCDAVIPIWREKIEVLHAFYSFALLAQLKTCLKSGRFRITDALGEAHVRYIQEPEIRPLDPQGLSFRNINVPSDFEEIA